MFHNYMLWEHSACTDHLWPKALYAAPAWPWAPNDMLRYAIRFVQRRGEVMMDRWEATVRSKVAFIWLSAVTGDRALGELTNDLVEWLRRTPTEQPSIDRSVIPTQSVESKECLISGTNNDLTQE